MRLNKLWFYYLSIANFFVFLCFFVFCCSRVKWLSLDNWGTERIFRCFGPARTLAWYCWNNCSPQFRWKWGIFTSTSVNNPQPNMRDHRRRRTAGDHVTKQGLQRQFLSGRGSLSHKPFTCRGHRDNDAESLMRESFSDSLRCNCIFGVYVQNNY